MTISLEVTPCGSVIDLGDILIQHSNPGVQNLLKIYIIKVVHYSMHELCKCVL